MHCASLPWRVVAGVCLAAWLAAGCKAPPTQAETSAVDYGPRPDNYEDIIREYLNIRLRDPVSAKVEFKAGPFQMYQQDTLLRPLRYGWAACVWVNDKNREGQYDGYFPMVFYIRNSKLVAVNGGPGDNIVGVRYAYKGCQELGTPFKR
jgi:hypothetical protein